MSRSDDSQFLENLFGKRAQILNLLKTESTLDFDNLRIAKGFGLLRRASEDLYEEADTKSFWKIDATNGVIQRVVDVDKNGIVKG